eukprot:355184-Chlamydomonas_euryale.AAC.2
MFESRVPHDAAVPTLEVARPTRLKSFGSLPREALAANGFRQVLSGICDEPGAEKLRPPRLY